MTEIQYTLEDDFEIVRQQIKRSKIKRYQDIYKSLFGMSLTRKIISLRDEGLTSSQVFARIIRIDSVKDYLFINPDQEKDFLKNVKIGVSARFSEEISRGR